MTLAEAHARANALAELESDPEKGHIELDKLLDEILIEVSETRNLMTARELARIAILAIANVPVRWYS